LHFGQFNFYSSHVCATGLVNWTAMTDYITLNAFTGADPGWWRLGRPPPQNLRK